MMTANRILLFGDSSDSPIPLIRQLLAKSQRSRNVKLFIQNVIDAVGWQSQSLSSLERESIGTVHNLQDLIECIENNRDHLGIARTILVFVARAGELILHSERDPSLLADNEYSPIISLGICGSLLPAAAAAVSSDIGELIEVSTFIATVAFRMAVEVARRALRIENNSGAWAFSALGEVVAQLPTIIEQFHQDQGIPLHRRAYIAMEGSLWATVYGPPSVLQSLVENSTALRKSEILMLPAAFGLSHAAHLTLPNLDKVIGESKLLGKKMKTHYHLISGSSFTPTIRSNLRILLAEVLEDIFSHSTSPDRVFEAGMSFLSKESEVSLYVLGNTAFLAPFKRTMQRKRFKVAVVSNVSIEENLWGLDGSESVAIIGMSGRFPGSESVEDLWTSLIEQKEFHKKIPSNRFDADAFFKEDAAYGCFLDHPGVFDHKLFNISPKEALRMDPGHRLLMHTTYEALEHAGLINNGSISTDTKRISTFVGLGGDDWREIQQSIGVDMHMVGSERAFAPGRINHYFNWEGGTYCVDSACASAATAVGLAFKALIDRDCDTAIAGGANIIATPFWHAALSKGGFLSTTGGCKTFREDADGYCRGEAVGVLVLKRLEDALRDNDNIVSVIRGYARNHSAEGSSIMHPHAKTQERLFKSLLHETGLDPTGIDYVECHGTGTIAGDSAELESVANVFAKPGSRETSLAVGAIKANLGHSEAAAGVVSLIKGALILQKATIPPQVGIRNKGRYPYLANGQIVIPDKSTPLSSQGSRRILVNNFDAAGGNSCFLLEEPPKLPPKTSDPRSSHVVTCSAHSLESFRQNKTRLLEFLKRNPQVSLANLAYTTTARRTHHALRAAYIGNTVEDIVKALAADIDGEHHESNMRQKKPVIFIFSGQGSQYEGMGRDLFQNSAQFRETIENLERIGQSQGFPPFKSLISDRISKIDPRSIVQAHLSIVALQIALVDLWKLWGVRPDVVIGHSLGEYAALYAAGVLSAFDAIYLVGKRAQLLQSKCVSGTHSMLSISASATQVSSFISEGDLRDCEIACINSPGMIVLSGERSEILKHEVTLKEQGFKCALLEIPYAMHSRQMDAISADFRSILDGVHFGKAKVQIISTLLGREVTDSSTFRGEYLVRQTREPVKFQQAVTSYAVEESADGEPLWLEIGPTANCLGLIRSNVNIQSSNALTSLRKGEDNWKTISSNLAKLYTSQHAINWLEYHKHFSDSVSLIDLPGYSFDTKDFWITYRSDNKQFSTDSALSDKRSQSEHISTCLHYCLKRSKNDDEQSASFISEISYPPLLEIIEGHKLSGINLTPAGVYVDMALTAARNLLTGGDAASPYPSLSVSDLQIDHPIVPTPGARRAIQIHVTKRRLPENECVVLFCDHTDSSSSPETARCVVRIHEQWDQELSSMIRQKMIKLVEADNNGLADRISGKVFYKLFTHLMDYSESYKGVRSAIVSEDFTEIIEDVRLPHHDKGDLSRRYTLSPYWLDVLGQAVGFLLNGNPDQKDDNVFLASHVEHMHLDARDINPDARYQVYAHVYHVEGSDYRGSAYLLRGDRVIGFSKGIRMRKMPRKLLHHVLGQPTASANQQDQTNRAVIAAKPNGNSTDDQAPQGAPPTSQKSLFASFQEILLAETGLEQADLLPSALFSELGVDSMISISIFAELKHQTAIELPTSFLLEHPTVKDAQKALRMLEHEKSGPETAPVLTNGHKETANGEPTTDGQEWEEVSNPSRESNVILISGRGDIPSRAALFLIADGAGSGAAYYHMPKISDNIPIYALESPWVNDPDAFTCSFNDAAALYLTAIRVKQAHGPYMLGGWSGGGVFAFEVARLLIQAGEKVDLLLIIDIPAPRPVDQSKVIEPTYDLIGQLGMLAGIDRLLDDDSPQAMQLKRHMLSTVRCFSKLDATPMKMTPGQGPAATCVVWAEENIFADTKALGSGLDAWFYPTERDAGPNGWNELVGGEVDCYQVPGDHFSIVNPPNVRRLSLLIQQLVFKTFATARR